MPILKVQGNHTVEQNKRSRNQRELELAEIGMKKNLMNWKPWINLEESELVTLI